MLDAGVDGSSIFTDWAANRRSHETILVQFTSACWSSHTNRGDGDCAKLLGDVGHLTWSEARQERVDGVANQLTFADILLCMPKVVGMAE
jgi:hypothetical protein